MANLDFQGCWPAGFEATVLQGVQVPCTTIRTLDSLWPNQELPNYLRRTMPHTLYLHP